MPTYQRKVMCDECPFRSKALPGWLGPHTIQDMEKIIHSEQPFICHKSIDEMIEDGQEEHIHDEGQHCVGILRYRNAVCKLGRDPEVFQVQKELKNVPDQPVIESMKFREHHEKSPFQEHKPHK